MSNTLPLHARSQSRRKRWFTTTSIAHTYRSDAAVFGSVYGKATLVTLLLLVVALPLVVGGVWLDLATRVALSAIGALALNLLTGTAGQISLGSAAMMGVGAYSSAFLAVEHGVAFPVVLVLSGLAAAAIGLVVGAPALRLRGLYLVIATLALHYIVIYLVQQYQSDRVGPSGFILPQPSILGWTIESERAWFYVLAASAASTAVIVTNILRSKYGRAWVAVRDRDIAASIIGVNVARYKLLAFTVSSFLIGVQGALFAFRQGVVSVDAFTLDVAIEYVAMIVIGGLGSVLGAFLGAAYVVSIGYAIREGIAAIPESAPLHNLLEDHIFDIRTAVYGLSIILFILLEPRGLAELWRRARNYFALWPFARRRGGDQ